MGLRASALVIVMGDGRGDVGGCRVRGMSPSGRMRVVGRGREGGKPPPDAACVAGWRRLSASGGSPTGRAARNDLVRGREAANVCQEGAAPTTCGGFARVYIFFTSLCPSSARGVDAFLGKVAFTRGGVLVREVGRAAYARF